MMRSKLYRACKTRFDNYQKGKSLTFFYLLYTHNVEIKNLSLRARQKFSELLSEIICSRSVLIISVQFSTTPELTDNTTLFRKNIFLLFGSYPAKGFLRNAKVGGNLSKRCAL